MVCGTVQGAHVNLCTKFARSISLACLLVPNSGLSRHGRHQYMGGDERGCAPGRKEWDE